MKRPDEAKALEVWNKNVLVIEKKKEIYEDVTREE